jgi:hypothetical protein
MFYPEPERKTCKFVEKKWFEECNLRVDLVEQKTAKNWNEATVTQKKLNSLYAELTDDLVKYRTQSAQNPYMKLYGDYELTTSESKAVQAALSRKKNSRLRLLLLSKWFTAKKARILHGFQTPTQLPTVRRYFATHFQPSPHSTSWKDFDWFTSKND